MRNFILEADSRKDISDWSILVYFDMASTNTLQGAAQSQRCMHILKNVRRVLKEKIAVVYLIIIFSVHILLAVFSLVQIIGLTGYPSCNLLPIADVVWFSILFLGTMCIWFIIVKIMELFRFDCSWGKQIGFAETRNSK